MNWQLNPYAIILILSAFVSGTLALYAWRRHTPGATSFAFLMLAVTVWSLGYALELASTDLSTILFWVKVEYPGIVAVPVMWLVFALEYSGKGKWLTRRNLILLFALPVFIVLLVWTSEFHRLYYLDVSLVASGSFKILHTTPGTWYWISVTYSYILFLSGTILFVLMFIRAPRLYRGQIGVVLIAALVPWVGNILYNSGSNSFFRRLDLTPLAFTITGLVIAWGLFRFKLLDILPIARNAVVESMSDGVIVLDAQARIVDMNVAAQKLVRYPLNKLVGQPLEQILLNRPDLVEQIRNVLETQTQITLGQGPELRHYELRISPLTNRRKKLTGRVIILHDITERKQAEAASQQAQEAAENANRAKSAFLANMSHELRTPLNVILGFSEMMARGHSLPPETQDNLKIIHRSGQYLLTLINDVLDMSKIEAGKTVLNEQNFDLNRLFEDLENMFHLRAKEKGLQFFFVRHPNLPRYIRADQMKLRQVLINLVNNALKFTTEGGVSVHINMKDEGKNVKEGKEIHPPASRLHISVSDTGPGIAPEEMESLFEAFAQTKTGQESQEGTGLGLSISRKFVQLMGGDIEVSSKVGRGVTFAFEVQVKAVDAAEVIGQGVRFPDKIIALEPGQPRYRILIVDDKKDNRQLLIKLLAPLGFDLQEAQNGQQAIEIWADWQPHLIWMDIRMPVMDGYEATRQIRNAERGTACPELAEGMNDEPKLASPAENSSFRPQPSAFKTVIIAVTASAFEEERAIVLESGCDDFLRKPFHNADVFDLIRLHLGVRYVYENGWQPKPETSEQNVLTVEALAAQPAQWRADLKDALFSIDLERTYAVIEQIQEHNPTLAGALKNCVDNFEYDKILNLI